MERAILPTRRFFNDFLQEKGENKEQILMASVHNSLKRLPHLYNEIIVFGFRMMSRIIQTKTDLGLNSS